MKHYKYDELTPVQKRIVRDAYVLHQKRLCMYCDEDLYKEPAVHVRNRTINLKLFPIGFLNHKIHLQHDHITGMTEGAVHAYCNAVMWQYEGR